MTRHHLASLDERIVRALRAGEMTAPELARRLGADVDGPVARLAAAGRIQVEKEHGTRGTRVLRLIR